MAAVDHACGIESYQIGGEAAGREAKPCYRQLTL